MSRFKHTNDKVLLLGFPSSGRVGTFSISYMVHYLQMQQIGEMDHPRLLPVLFIENGDIFGPIRIYKKNNLHVITSDLPFEANLAYDFAESVLEFCKKKNIDKVIMVCGLESSNPTPSDCKVYGLVTHQILEKELYEAEIPKFLTGSISGTEAAIISLFRTSNIPVMVLYAECHPLFPDANATKAITLLSKIIKVKIDTRDIQKKLEYLRVQHCNLIQETIDALQQQEKKSQTRPPQIYR